MQGLQNLGSTCAVNSLIQIICRTTHLRNIILNTEMIPSTLSNELKEILDMMHNKGHSLSPKKFVKHLYQHLDVFRLGEQIDIGELWMFLFDKLATEQEKPIIISEFQQIVLDNLQIIDNEALSKSEELILHCRQTVTKMNNNKTSQWLESCQGIMLGIIQCDKCNHTLYNFEPFISIPLDIPEEYNEKSPPSISVMFRNYLKPQKCKGDWKCEKCNEMTDYTKLMKIWKMPPVLTFIIKRFTNMAIKNNNPININKKMCIKMGSILCDPMSEISYKCTSFALHFGNLQGGHYCCVCDIGDKYVFYDDLNISVLDSNIIEKQHTYNRDAYMIVYSSCS